VLVISALGFNLVLPIGVVGHEGSTVLVCLNGLRLLSFKTECFKPFPLPSKE
jgi:Zn2+/Cd2+-exporting ATPase